MRSVRKLILSIINIDNVRNYNNVNTRGNHEDLQPRPLLVETTH